jgi:hypothetical protein
VTRVQDVACSAAHQGVIIGDQDAQVFHGVAPSSGMVTRTLVP